MNNDMKFFTNEPERNLYDRFNKILNSNTEFFDVLVGYFRASGFYLLQDAIDNVEHTRILIGINTDKEVLEIYQESQQQINELSSGAFESKNKYKEMLKNEFRNSEDSIEVEKGVNKFISMLRNKKIELRVYTKQPIHAKVYIMRKDQTVSDEYGKVITGSSNFSYNGLKNNLEFNVELKDYADVKFAEDKFNELWNDSVDISKECIDTIEKDTWIKNDITPYEMYLKFLYEYFKEELNDDKLFNFDDNRKPKGFKLYQYQSDAVVQAYKTLEKHNGVFISDVVGLGKTYICALLAEKLPGKKLFLVPPVLVDYWEEVLRDFFVGGCTVRSNGNLTKIVDTNMYVDYDYIFIDEAHKYRNEETIGYGELSEICSGKKVILITATPQNNYVTDIASQMYLFESRKNSTIPGVKRLQDFFEKLRKDVKKHQNDDDYLSVVRSASEKIRDDVLREVMIRRTRSEIQKNYKDDIEKQGLKFPLVHDPNREVYEFDDETELVFEKTITAIKNITYARYQTLLFVKDNALTPEQKSLKIGQKNMGGFMKGILVKRLESSKFAFNMTLSRFIDSHEKFIGMYEKGSIRISNKIKNIDLYSDDAFDILMESDLKNDVMVFDSKDIDPKYIEYIKADLNILKELKDDWDSLPNDCKLDSFIELLKKDEKLKNKIIIFTESSETAEYLASNIENKLQRNVIMFNGSLSPKIKEDIRNNFDPNVNSDNKQDTYDVLVTTDVLAEGMNLHRSNVIINYDLPWNPTRIMQRVGRINRVGSDFNDLYIYNFFPTTSSDDLIHQEANIVSKIQMFHDILGEDSKFLTKEEKVATHELFKKMNSTYEEEESGFSDELKYLREIREIRDNNHELFVKIKKFPQKIKIGRVGSEEKLITFFRKGYVKKFYLSNKDYTDEIRFSEAIKDIKASLDEKCIKINNNYYDLLTKNKNEFDAFEKQEKEELVETRTKGKNNAQKIEEILKYILQNNLLDDESDQKCQKIIMLLQSGIVPKIILKNLVKEYENNEKTKEKIVELYYKIDKSIKPTFIEQIEKEKIKENIQREIILSEMFIK